MSGGMEPHATEVFAPDIVQLAKLIIIGIPTWPTDIPINPVQQSSEITARRRRDGLL
jgi:hypothetical protein